MIQVEIHNRTFFLENIDYEWNNDTKQMNVQEIHIKIHLNFDKIEVIHLYNVQHLLSFDVVLSNSKYSEIDRQTILYKKNLT